MKASTKLILGVTFGVATYALISLIEPLIENPIGKKEKFPMPEQKNDLPGTYSCKIEYKSDSPYFRKNYGDDFIKMPGIASVKFVRKGLRKYEIEYSGASNVHAMIKTTDVSRDGEKFSLTGTKESTGLEHYGVKISDVCKSLTQIDGQLKSDGVDFNQKITNQNNSNIKCVLDNNEGQFTAKYSCTRVSEKPSCINRHKSVFIRPCSGQLFSDGTLTKTRVGPGSIEALCQDLRDGCVTDIFLGFKVDHENKCIGDGGKPLIVGTPLFPRAKTNDAGTRPDSGNTGVSNSAKDSIKEIMNECGDMNIHAWVPLFNDPYAIGLLGGPEKVGLKASTASYIGYSDRFADPENPSVVEYQLKILGEILKEYPIMGINLDYIRYSDEPPQKDPKTKQQPYWNIKAKVIDSFVQSVKDMVARSNPNIVLSADVMSNEVARIAYGQQGIPALVDVIMPMSYSRFYTTSSALPGIEGNPELARMAETAELRLNIESLKLANPGKHILPILRGWKIKQSSEGLISDLKEDVSISLQVADSGYGIFTYESLMSETGLIQLSQIKVDK